MLKKNNKTVRFITAIVIFLTILFFILISKNFADTYSWQISSNIYSDSTIEGEIKQENQFTINEGITLTITSSSSLSLDNPKADINKMLSNGGRLVIEKGATLDLNYSTDLRILGNGIIENYGTINNNGKVMLYGLKVFNYGSIKSHFPLQLKENSSLISLIKPSKDAISFDNTSNFALPLSLINNENTLSYSVNNSILKSSITTKNINLKEDPNIKITFKNNLPTFASIKKVYTSKNFVFEFAEKKDSIPKATLQGLDINLGSSIEIAEMDTNINESPSSIYSSNEAIVNEQEQETATIQKTTTSIFLSLKENLKKGNYKTTIIVVLETSTNKTLNIPFTINLTYENKKEVVKKEENNKPLPIVSLIMFFLFIVFFIANVIKMIMIKTRKSMFLMKKGGSILSNIIAIFFCAVGCLFFLLVNDFTGKVVTLDIFTGWIFSVLIVQIIFFTNSIRKN